MKEIEKMHWLEKMFYGIMFALLSGLFISTEIQVLMTVANKYIKEYTFVLVAEAIVIIISFCLAKIMYKLKIKKIAKLLSEHVLEKMKENKLSGSVQVQYLEKKDYVDIYVALYSSQIKSIRVDVHDGFTACEEFLNNILKKEINIIYDELPFWVGE